MRAKLEGAGVVCDFVEVVDWETTLKLRVLGQRQQLIRLDFERPPPEPVTGRVLDSLERHLAAADTLIIEDYDKGVVDAPEGIVAAAKRSWRGRGGRPQVQGPGPLRGCRHRQAESIRI